MPKNVDIYLRNAFRELEAFSVPGIGTFRKVFAHARLDPEQQQAFPPEVRLTFDPGVDARVSLRRYLERKLLLREDAAQRILQDIEETITSAIASEGTYELPEIGRLYRQETGQLAFAAHPAGQFAGDFFGFMPVALMERPPSDENTPDMPPLTPESPARTWLPGWRPVLLLLLLGAMGYLLVTQGPFTKSRSSLSQGLQVRFDPPASAETLADADSLSGPVLSDGRAPAAPREETLPAAPLPQRGDPTARLGAPRGEEAFDAFAESVDISVLDTARSPRPAPATRDVRPPAPRNTPTYHLIGGSFSTQQAAERYVARARQEGNNPIILFPPQGSSLTYRVSLFSHPSRQEVEAYSERLKRQGKKEGWIFEELPQP